MKIAEVVMVMTNTPKGLTNNRIAGKVITNKQKKDGTKKQTLFSCYL